MILNKIFIKVIGDSECYSLENIIFNALAFISATIAIIITIKEIAYQLSFGNVLIGVISSLFFCILYILGKKSIAVNFLNWIFLFVVTLIIFGDWFVVTGVNGTAWPIYIAMSAIIQVIFSGRHLIFANIWHVFYGASIYIISQIQPQFVNGLVNWNLDLTYYVYDIALISFALGFSIQIMMRSYRQQHKNNIHLNSNLKKAVTKLENNNTELSLAQQELMIARDEANQANKTKSDFLSGMSHEIRTPLNAIIGFTQLLEMKCSDDDSKENLSEITNAGMYILSLTDDILDISKIEADKINISISPCNLNLILEECIPIIKKAADQRSINIDNTLKQSSTNIINVDEMRFRQVLLNILSNAVKYNSENGKITINCEAYGDGMLRLSILDTGVGLSNEQIEKLFIPFVRFGAENSRIEGTGLGLVISKKMMELMNGEIGIESKIGEGSCFWLLIPIVK